MVACPICEQPVRESNINNHIDSGCKLFVDEPTPPATQTGNGAANTKTTRGQKAADFFTPSGKKGVPVKTEDQLSPLHPSQGIQPPSWRPSSTAPAPAISSAKREWEEDEHGSPPIESRPGLAVKKAKTSHAPLAERMRPQSLDEVAGQELVGPEGVLRNLILTDRVPSMILWGGPGTGKTTIARLIAQTAGTRFVEINSTSSGVAECKKLFSEARNERGLTGRKTIIFCDEIHRFSKSQQDVFLGPVEAGDVTLIGATTENPSFKVVNALLSRCRTFTLAKLTDNDVFSILKRALAREFPDLTTETPDYTQNDKAEDKDSRRLLVDNNFSLIRYLATFADGDARTGLNLLELSLDLCQKPTITSEDIKKSLTQTLVYDRAGDQHYDTISAFHKSVRGSNADAALYYLARMLQSGEDPLYIARRMVVMASEDIGLADNSMLSLATATYTAAEKIGMPECRINLAHCTVALSLAPKSVRAYRALNAAYSAISKPGIAGLPVPVHLRNAPTKLLKELGYGKQYKYNPDFVDGQVMQEYLPDKLRGQVFLKAQDLGDEVDEDVLEPGDIECAEELLLNPDGD